MPEPRLDLAAIRERWVEQFTGAGFYDMEAAFAWRNEQAEGDIRALVARVEELEAALRRIEQAKWTESGDALGAAGSELRAIYIAKDALATAQEEPR